MSEALGKNSLGFFYCKTLDLMVQHLSGWLRQTDVKGGKERVNKDHQETLQFGQYITTTAYADGKKEFYTS